MTEAKDYLGEKLRLVERAREDAYFRKLDQELIADMRQQAASAAQETARVAQRFTSILVPVDFSAYSTEALVCAADIAARFGSSIIALHVIAREITAQTAQQQLRQQQTSQPAEVGATEPFSDVSTQNVEAVVISLRERAYAALQDFLPPQLGQHDVELRVISGHPFERILETAVQAAVGLIVMGTHGRTGLAHVIMGSVAERIVRLAPCPVLTVKATTEEETGWLQQFYETFMPA